MNYEQNITIFSDLTFPNFDFSHENKYVQNVLNLVVCENKYVWNA